MLARPTHLLAAMRELLDFSDLYIPQSSMFAPLQQLFKLYGIEQHNCTLEIIFIIFILLFVDNCFIDMIWLVKQISGFLISIIIFSGVMMQSGGIRFLVATDIHLGHKEKHSVRHNDSYEGFEQVIDHAKQQNVDFLLLGGDLFDEVNPSKECFFRCLNILKQNVFGNRHANLKVSLNGKEYKSNLQNQDFNISLPIFTIHGNHDYPTNQFGKISACDLLQASNYVNYFGKYLNLQNIVIRPLIITKTGTTTKIALYGLGYIKDQVLNQLFESKKVKFQLPEGNIDEYMKIFVFHQNRYKKGFRPGAPIHQSFNAKNIPEWMNLVIWGHQHEAIYKLQTQHERAIYQPGSTVLTSYIQTQSFKKQCVLINASLLLQKSYRPMRIINLDTKTLRSQHGEEFDFLAYLDDTIKNQIQESLKESSKKPIIRIKIQCSSIGEMFNARTIQAKYFDKVANGDKILMLWRRKAEKQIKVEDDQVLRKIKNKEIERNTNTIIQQMQNIIHETCNNFQTKVFPKKNLLQVMSYLSKADNINAADIVKKKCGEMQVRKQRAQNEQLIKLAADKQIEFKRSLKYHYDRKQMNFNKNPDVHLYNYSSKEDFFNLKDQFLNQNKFLLNCKILEEHAQSKEQNGQNKSVTLNNSSKSCSSYMTRGRKEEIQIPEIVQRSDSQDCCQRAQKTPIDEIANRMNYKQSQQKLNHAMKAAQYKKSAISNTKRQSDSKQDKKVMKNVKFSLDFM